MFGARCPGQPNDRGSYLMATDDQVRLYEGLFLLRQEAASTDFGGCVDFLRATFDRAEAEVVVLRKWDERRLAAEIKSLAMDTTGGRLIVILCGGSRRDLATALIPRIIKILAD